MHWVAKKLQFFDGIKAKLSQALSPKKIWSARLVDDNASGATEVAQPELADPMEVTKNMLVAQGGKVPEYAEIKLQNRVYSLDSKPGLAGFFKGIGHKINHWADVFKAYPVRMSLSFLTNAAMLMCIPILSFSPLAIMTVAGLLLYQHFTGSILYFNKSMSMYGNLTQFADKSDGDKFIQKASTDKAVGSYLLSKLDESENKKFTDIATGLTITRGKNGTAKLRFSYAVAPEDARDFNHYMHDVIAQADQDLRVIEENHGKKSSQYREQKKILGALESIRWMADKRATLSLAGRRQRGLANRWYYDLDKLAPNYQLPESLQNNPGVFVHKENGKSILQINYQLKRSELNILLTSLTESMRAQKVSDVQINEFIEKIRIGYKIVETNFNADIHGESFLELAADKRMNLAVEVSTFTAMPPFVAHNLLYSSVHQLDTTNLRLVMNMMNNATNGFEVQTQGLGAMARIIEARMNAMLKITSNFSGAVKSKKDKGSDHRSHNYKELALQLADPYGRRITPNVVLAETIQEALPADGQERAMLLNALYDLNLYNNVDGDTYLFHPNGKKLFIEDENQQRDPEGSISVRRALKDILLHSESNFKHRGRELTEEQIDNFVNLLIYNRAIQKQSEVFAALIAKFHRSGKLEPNEQAELAVMITNRYAVEQVQAEQIVKDLIKYQEKVAATTKEYLDADLGWDKINNINADDLTSVEEFINLVSYGKTFTFAQKAGLKAYVTEVLEGKVSYDKVDMDKFKTEFGEDVANWMGGKKDASIGGIEEALRWSVEYYLRKEHSVELQYQEQNPGRKNDLRQIQSKVKKYDGVIRSKAKLSEATQKLIAAGKFKGISYEGGELVGTADALRRIINHTEIVKSGDDRKAVLEAYKKANQYVSTFDSDDERRVMMRTVELTTKALNILENHRFNLQNIKARMIEKQKDPYFKKLSFFDQYKAIMEEDHEVMRSELLAENIPTELIDSLMGIMEEGEILQQATIRGMIFQTNKIIDNAARIDGKVILDASSKSELVQLALRSREQVAAAQKKAPADPEQKKVFDAVKKLLEPFGGKKFAGGPNYWQLAYGEASKGLAAALFRVANHTKGIKYKTNEHWNVSVADLIGGEEYLGGGELKENYGDRELTLATIENLAKDKNISAVIAELKKLDQTQIQEAIDAAVQLLNAEATFGADLEAVMEKEFGMMRDAAVVAAEVVKGQVMKDPAVVTTINMQAFVSKYHDKQNPGSHYKYKAKNDQGEEKEYELFSDKLMKEYITKTAARIKITQAKPKKKSEEPETMFRFFRSSPDDDQNGKPGIFNMSYVGITPFENMQKTMKVVMQWYRQWNGAYTLSQVWEKFKEEQLRDTMSIPFKDMYHRGAKYPFWDMLDKAFSEMDKNFSMQEFDGVEELDKKRNYYKKLDEVFQKKTTELLNNPEMQEFRDTMIRVKNAGLTMGERLDASFQANIDKDNYLYKTYMSMITNVFKPKEDGSIVNETTVLVQAQQDLYFSMFNKLQQSAMIDMHDFRTTEAYVLGQQGREQDQGCFNIRNRKFDTYFHLTRSALEISTPTNAKPPRFMPRILAGLAAFIPSAGALFLAFQGLMLLPFLPLLVPQLLIPILAYVLFFKVAPKIQNRINKAYRRWDQKRNPFTPAMLRRTLDLSKKYSSVEDYRAKTEAIKSFLIAIQSYSMQGAALAESDWDVQIRVQFPRWNLAHLELEATEGIDQAFIEHLVEENKLAHEVYEDLAEHYAESKQNNKYPMMAMYNLRFSTIMTTYAATGLSIFAFSGVLLTGLLSPVALIVAFGALSIGNYAMIKRSILRHHKNVGISRRNEKVAEDRFAMINAILVPKILNVAVSLAKMPFLSSEPIFAAMRQYFPDLYLGKIDSNNYALEFKNEFAGRLSNFVEKMRKRMPQFSVAANIFYAVAFNLVAIGLQAFTFGATVLANMLFFLPSFSLLAFAWLGYRNLYRRMKNFVNNGMIGISTQMEYKIYKEEFYQKDIVDQKLAA